MFSPAYKRYALAVITLVCALNYLDRGVMMLLLQPIKEDLRLTDTQLGFVTGIAFSLFYATLGVLIARWADRGNRVTITSLAIGLWGLTVMGCLFVTNYVQLLIARIAAAVGESGGEPPTYSLLGDYFPEPAERTRAMYIYQAASPVTGLLSYVLAGWLNELYGWRLTFFLLGIPGLLLAVLVKFTLVEPRTRMRQAHPEPPPATSMIAVMAMLWRSPSCRHLTFAMILILTMGAGLGSWDGAFLVRSHGMRTAELGIWFGCIFGLGGLVALGAGGYVVNRWFAGNERGQMRLAALAVASTVAFFIAFLTLPNKHHALMALLCQTLLLNAFLPLPLVLLQQLVPDEMRATSYMVMMLLANLIGLGLGPQLVGIMSDLTSPRWGTDALRFSMLILSFLGVWAGLHFWRVGRVIQQELSRTGRAT